MSKMTDHEQEEKDFDRFVDNVILPEKEDSSNQREDRAILKFNTIGDIVDHLKRGNYKNSGGCLNNDIAFLKLEKARVTKVKECSK